MRLLITWNCNNQFRFLFISLSMFSGLRKSLRVIDFYQSVPNQISEGTISGACISIVSIGLLIILTLYSFKEFNEPLYVTDLIIDQKHLTQKLKVNIDIQFPAYPCSFLSLDIQNVLKLHLVNVNEHLDKISLPQGTIYNQRQLNQQQRLERIKADLSQKKGCRVKGWFQIDRVPGNFHFSCHAYGGIVPEILNSGHRTFDLTHKINTLSFGQNENRLYGSNSLGNFNSQKQVPEGYLGISYTYFLDIIQHNQIDSNTKQNQDTYFYTARLNEVVMGSMPMVYFKYETNPVTIIEIVEEKQWHIFLIEFVGILGGIFTVSAIIDNMVHSSIRFLLEKHRMGKLA